MTDDYLMPHEREEYAHLIERIKEHEGYRNTVYLDSLGKATIGYGHLITPEDTYVEDMEYSRELLDRQFGVDFDNAYLQAQELMDDYRLPFTAQTVIIEMVFQLGVGNVSKFKKMWEALREHDFETAADEMVDSRWHKQTPQRCEYLANTMATCGIA